MAKDPMDNPCQHKGCSSHAAHFLRGEKGKEVWLCHKHAIEYDKRVYGKDLSSEADKAEDEANKVFDCMVGNMFNTREAPATYREIDARPDVQAE